VRRRRGADVHVTEGFVRQEARQRVLAGLRVGLVEAIDQQHQVSRRTESLATGARSRIPISPVGLWEKPLIFIPADHLGVSSR
jgi:hypothetical protein